MSGVSPLPCLSVRANYKPLQRMPSLCLPVKVAFVRTCPRRIFNKYEAPCWSRRGKESRIEEKRVKFLSRFSSTNCCYFFLPSFKLASSSNDITRSYLWRERSCRKICGLQAQNGHFQKLGSERGVLSFVLSRATASLLHRYSGGEIGKSDFRSIHQ